MDEEDNLFDDWILVPVDESEDDIENDYYGNRRSI